MTSLGRNPVHKLTWVLFGWAGRRALISILCKITKWKPFFPWFLHTFLWLYYLILGNNSLSALQSPTNWGGQYVITVAPINTNACRLFGSFGPSVEGGVRWLRCWMCLQLFSLTADSTVLSYLNEGCGCSLFRYRGRLFPCHWQGQPVSPFCWFTLKMLEARNSIQVLPGGGGDPSTWAITCRLPGCTQQEAGVGKGVFRTQTKDSAVRCEHP